jgi:polysaccharide deacetylase family protein (PEP-CTERM system associated)
MSVLLLSIDLEDVRDWVENGHQYKPGLDRNVAKYLEFFAELQVRATFFVVGSIARRYPALIKTILGAGHELACHSDTHLQITKQSRKEFYEDIIRNKQTLEELSGQPVTGYRAPTFSLIPETAWAHEELARAGFRYSSSVLPSRNPLYGWQEFGTETRRMESGIWELPMTLHDIPMWHNPIAGGVYFRVLPFWLTLAGVKRCLRQNIPVTTYFHPYDIDTEQERFMHPDLNNSRLLNLLMYIGRAKVLDRLRRIRRLSDFMPYGDYVETVLEQGVQDQGSTVY